MHKSDYQMRNLVLEVVKELLATLLASAISEIVVGNHGRQSRISWYASPTYSYPDRF